MPLECDAWVRSINNALEGKSSRSRTYSSTSSTSNSRIYSSSSALNNLYVPIPVSKFDSLPLPTTASILENKYERDSGKEEDSYSKIFSNSSIDKRDFLPSSSYNIGGDVNATNSSNLLDRMNKLSISGATNGTSAPPAGYSKDIEGNLNMLSYQNSDLYTFSTHVIFLYISCVGPNLNLIRNLVVISLCRSRCKFHVHSLISETKT